MSYKLGAGIWSLVSDREKSAALFTDIENFVRDKAPIFDIGRGTGPAALSLGAAAASGLGSAAIHRQRDDECEDSFKKRRMRNALISALLVGGGTFGGIMGADAIDDRKKTRSRQGRPFFEIPDNDWIGTAESSRKRS